MAAQGGHLGVLRWARDNGCPWTADVCCAAAGTGRLGVLQYCRENGCPWDEGTTINAAANGHLSVLRWSVNNGCRCPNDWCVGRAEEGGHHHVVEWLQEARLFNRFVTLCTRALQS